MTRAQDAKVRTAVRRDETNKEQLVDVVRERDNKHAFFVDIEITNLGSVFTLEQYLAHFLPEVNQLFPSIVVYTGFVKLACTHLQRPGYARDKSANAGFPRKQRASYACIHTVH